MKNLLLLIFLFTAYNLFSQTENEIKDVSPDGKEISIYSAPAGGYVERNGNSVVPYGNTPSWKAAVDRQIGGLVWGDFDNDGDLDLAAGCYFSQSFPPINDYETIIFRNDNGVLTSNPAWVSADERSTTDVRWADVNGDGFLDLLSANGNGSMVPSVIYFGSASGLSTSPGWISSDFNWTVGAAFCDVDGDGDLDLAFANQGIDPNPYRPINIFYNNNGVLSTIPDYASSDQMISNVIAFADIDNSDLTSASKTITANGTGSVYHLPHVPLYKIDSVFVDGIQTDNFCFDGISSWVSLGFIPLSGEEVKIHYTYIKKADMAASKWVNFESGIYMNNNGAMAALPGWTTGHSQSQKGIAWADFDLDGYMDFAVGGSNIQTQIYKNNAGTISSAPVWSSNTSSTGVQDLIWGDVNKDGYPDLAVVHFGSKRVEIFLNNAGSFDPVASWVYVAASSATAIAFGDLNGDGFLDLAVGTARNPITVFLADPAMIPVELISFTANAYGKQVELNWITATEANNSGFEIQRSDVRGQSSEWINIAFVEGSGTTTETREYSFTDKLDLEHELELIKYRLKQIDYDGSFQYSKIIEIEIINDLQFILDQNYPNPFNPATKISFHLPQSGNVTLKIYNLLGKEITVLLSENKTAGSYEVNFDAAGLSSGVYFYELKLNSNGKIFKAVKKLSVVK